MIIPPQQIFDQWMEGYQMKQIAAELKLSTTYVSKMINKVIDDVTEQHSTYKNYVQVIDRVGVWPAAYSEYRAYRTQYMDQLMAARAFNRRLRKNKT